jgi:hypothetical protein
MGIGKRSLIYQFVKNNMAVKAFALMLRVPQHDTHTHLL